MNDLKKTCEAYQLDEDHDDFQFIEFYIKYLSIWREHEKDIDLFGNHIRTCDGIIR